MAFLDNSGDIILDAVLTDEGRRLMAGGRGITISKFALGDDEINYGSFDKGHPSGSAYYDLELLQTPVFEATTRISANINFGLLSFRNTNLLYMPQWVQNSIDTGTGFATPHNKIYYIAVNTETLEALTNSVYTFKDLPQKLIQAGSPAHRVIAYELGLNTSEIAKNMSAKRQYIDTMGIRDQSYVVSVNSLFIGDVQALRAGAPAYSNNLSDNSLATFPSPRDVRPAGRHVASRNKTNYRDFTVKGSAVNIFEPHSATTTASRYSAISGPSNSIVMLNLSVQGGLDHARSGVRDRRYSQYGKIAQTTQQAFGTAGSDGFTYDYIDTTIYLEATTTGASISIPVRLIRRAS